MSPSTNNEKLIRDVTITILRSAETTLPSDVKEALVRAYECETNEIAKVQLKAMVENIKLADEMQRPLCQDTGIPLFYVKLGSSNVNIHDIESGIREGVKEATEIIPLRPNVVDAITRAGGEAANVGDRMPYINYRIETDMDGPELEITAFPKGGGSENVSAFNMLTPKPEEEAKRAIKKFVLFGKAFFLRKVCYHRSGAFFGKSLS